MPKPHRIGRCGVCLALLLAVSPHLEACSPYEVESRDHLGRLGRSTYPVVILGAPQLLMEHAAYESYQYGTDLAALLSAEGRIPVITAWEADITQEQEGDVSNSQIMTLIDQVGVSLTDVLIAEVRVAESATSRTVQVPLQMGGGLEHHYQSDVTVTLTLTTATYHEDVGVITVQFEDPPFSDQASAANPRPVLRDGILEAGRLLIEHFEDRFAEPPRGVVPAVELAYNPRDLFLYREVDHEPLEERFNGMDELDRLVSRMVYYQYFDPAISGSQMRRFESSESGLLVVDAEDGAQGLQPGDYIDSVDGQRVAGTHTFARAFLLASPGQEVRLTLTRNGERRVLRVPVRDISD